MAEDLEKKKKREKKNRIVRSIILGIFLIGGISALVKGIPVVGWPVIGIILLLGLRIVPMRERWTIEFFGRFFRVYSPGIKWIFPIYPVMNIRKKIPIWEYSIELFLEKPWIDFLGGGSAQLINPQAWIEVGDEKVDKTKIKREDERKIREAVFKATYNIADYEVGVRENIEIFLRSCLNRVRVEEAMTWSGDILDQISKTKKFLGETNRLMDKLKAWGVGLKKITLTDFEWSEEVKKSRREIYERERRKEAMKHEAAARKREIGMSMGEIKKSLVKDYGYPNELAEEIAREVYKHLISAETKSLTHIKWETIGGARFDLTEAIAKIVKVIETVRGGGKKPEKEKEEKGKEVRVPGGTRRLSEEERKRLKI